MKILVDLVRVRQDWNPDTNEQTNSIIFRFAGREIEIPASEEDIAAAVREAAGQRDHQPREARPQRPVAPQAAPEELDDLLGAETALDSDDEVFGGDFDAVDEDQPVSPPSLFQAEPTTPPDDGSALPEELIEKPAAPPVKPFVVMAGRVLNDAQIQQLSEHQKARAIADTKARLEAGDPAIKRAHDKFLMRLRAQQVRPRTVAQDELGYPQGVRQRAPAQPTAQTTSRRPAAEVTVQTSHAPVDGDDDGFGQG